MHPIMQQKIPLIQQDVAVFVAQNENVAITNDVELNAAVEVEIAAKKRIKRIEDLRVAFVKPLNDQVKMINDTFKKEAQPLINLEFKIKSARRTYALELEAIAQKKRAEEFQKARESQDEVGAGIQSILAVPEPETAVRTSEGTASIKKVWTFEVEDEKKLRKYYPQLFVLDEKALRAMITGGKREIAGVRVFQDFQAVTRIS